MHGFQLGKQISLIRVLKLLQLKFIFIIKLKKTFKIFL